MFMKLIKHLTISLDTIKVGILCTSFALISVPQAQAISNSANDRGLSRIFQSVPSQPSQQRSTPGPVYNQPGPSNNVRVRPQFNVPGPQQSSNMYGFFGMQQVQMFNAQLQQQQFNYQLQQQQFDVMLRQQENEYQKLLTLARQLGGLEDQVELLTWAMKNFRDFVKQHRHRRQTTSDVAEFSQVLQNFNNPQRRIEGEQQRRSDTENQRRIEAERQRRLQIERQQEIEAENQRNRELERKQRYEAEERRLEELNQKRIEEERRQLIAKAERAAIAEQKKIDSEYMQKMNKFNRLEALVDTPPLESEQRPRIGEDSSPWQKKRLAMLETMDKPLIPNPEDGLFLGSAVGLGKFALKGIAKAAISGAGKVFCFPGETPICIKDDSVMGYHSEPIASIQVGDTVASCNLELGEEACECRQVQQVFKNTADHLIQLSFDGKILKTTDEHPFYVVNKKDWVEARYLRIGDQLQSISGEIVLLDDISEEYGQFDVYNLDVQGNHNYYAADVLVHNCNEGSKVAAELVASNALRRAEIFAAIESRAARKDWPKVVKTVEGRNVLQDLFHLKSQKGLTDISDGTRKQAEVIGEAWVNGKYVRRFDLGNGGYGITDGTRTFRLQFKPKAGAWKSNFQENVVSDKGIITEIKNVHMSITDM